MEFYVKTKHYHVFDQVIVPYFVDGYRNEEITGLKIVGEVHAINGKLAIAGAKRQGFKCPIVQENRNPKEQSYVASLESADIAIGGSRAALRSLHGATERHGYTRKS